MANKKSATKILKKVSETFGETKKAVTFATPNEKEKSEEKSSWKISEK